MHNSELPDSNAAAMSRRRNVENGVQQHQEEDEEEHVDVTRNQENRVIRTTSFGLSKDILTYFRDSRDFIRGETDTLAFAEVRAHLTDCLSVLLCLYNLSIRFP